MAELKIGPVVYDVMTTDQFIANDEDEEDPRQLGSVDINTHVILIRKDLKPPVHAITLWHEVLHALCMQAGRDVKEGLIEALAYGIYQVIRDNEDLVRMTERIAE